MGRKIKIDGVVHDFDISDGKGDLPSGCNGLGGRTVLIDEIKATDNGFVEGSTRMWDGQINYTRKERQSFGDPHTWILDDSRVNALKVKGMSGEVISTIPEDKRIETVHFCLKYYPLEHVVNGYRFGRELWYNDVCITMSASELVVYTSLHNGFIVPDYLALKLGNDGFAPMLYEIQRSINRYFGFDPGVEQGKQGNRPTMDPICKIYGSEISYVKWVPLSALPKVAADMWASPHKHCDYKEGSDDIWERFCKYLWIHIPGVEEDVWLPGYVKECDETGAEHDG